MDPIDEMIVDAAFDIVRNEDGSYNGGRILAALLVIATTIGVAVWIATY